LTNEQKAAAVAVIFYAGVSSDVLGAKTLGVGLKNTADSGLQWAHSGTSGFGTNFTDILCKPSGTSYTGKPKPIETSYTATTTFTGDLDGSDNWAKICAVDKTAAANAATNYPAFNWVNSYASTYSLSSNYTSGWYLPTIAELCMMYRAKSTVNSALEKAGGTKIASKIYWSSNQHPSFIAGAWLVWFTDAFLTYGFKDFSISVCAIHAF